MIDLFDELRLQNPFPFIKRVKILIEDEDYLKAIIYFKDKSNLRISLDREKNSYSFYWLDKKNGLIIGWDNRPHHPEISTFPHHKHVGLRKNVQPSKETTLEKVLKFIRKKIC